MRILVVEDDLRMAGLLKRGLEQETYSVDVGATAREPHIRPVRGVVSDR